MSRPIDAEDLRSVGVVLVNHRSGELVDACVRALEDVVGQVVVVDNSGEYAGGGTVVVPGTNLGFGRACNLGVATLRPELDVVCFHNPDLTLEPEGLERLVARLSAQPRPGIVAPALRTGSSLRTHGYAYPSVAREAWLTLRAVSASLRTGRATDIARPEPQTPGTTGRRFGSGACLVVSRAALRAVGGFDERYFLYVEDLALWDAICSAGFGVSFEPQVIARHDRGGGGDASNARRELLRWIGVEYFLASRGRPTWRVIRLLHRIGLLVLRRREPALSATVGRAWRRGWTPAAVMETVRDELAVASGSGAST